MPLSAVSARERRGERKKENNMREMEGGEKRETHQDFGHLLHRVFLPQTKIFTEVAGEETRNRSSQRRALVPPDRPF